MKRKTFDSLVSATGLLLVVVLATDNTRMDSRCIG